MIFILLLFANYLKKHVITQKRDRDFQQNRNSLSLKQAVLLMFAHLKTKRTFTERHEICAFNFCPGEFSCQFTKLF